jgi:hypothetical protein
LAVFFAGWPSLVDFDVLRGGLGGGVRSIEESAPDAPPSLTSLCLLSLSDSLQLSDNLAGDGEFGGVGWTDFVAFCNSETVKAARPSTTGSLFDNMEADFLSKSPRFINKEGFFFRIGEKEVLAQAPGLDCS